MIVVADSSPLIVLFGIGHIDILPELFGQVIIPPTVSAELRNSRRSEKARDFFISPIPWLVIRAPVSSLPIAQLHAGETEALQLAIELHAELLLVDDRDAYRAAVARNVNAAG